jgi:hypothetical protein
MALRAAWGSQQKFIVSVGGFHAKYDPPSTFPTLDRVSASLATGGGNPRIELSGYLAVTPNTFQVGAGVLLHGEFGPAVVHGELSFDALFRFDPFSFVVDFYAKLMFKISGSKLGLEIDGTLSGPKPWRLNGSVSISLLFVSVTVNVDVSIGSEPPEQELPPADVLSKLQTAVSRAGNWTTKRPEGDSAMVTLRDAEGDDDDDLSSHPLGSLGVRQTVVPLGVRIDTFGNATPKHHTFELKRFRVTGGSGSPSNGEQVGAESTYREQFAPAKYREMSDAEKMNAPAFESLPAGTAVGNGLLRFGGQTQSTRDQVRRTTLEYEATVVDETNDDYRTRLADLSGDWDRKLDVGTGHELARSNAVATGDLRTTGENRYDGTDRSVSVDDRRYVVVDAADLTPKSSIPDNDLSADGGMTRVEADDARRAYEANHPDDDVRVVAAHAAREP